MNYDAIRTGPSKGGVRKKEASGCGLELVWGKGCIVYDNAGEVSGNPILVIDTC